MEIITLESIDRWQFETASCMKDSGRFEMSLFDSIPHGIHKFDLVYLDILILAIPIFYQQIGLVQNSN